MNERLHKMFHKRVNGAGFTLIELVMSLTVGLVVLSGALSFGIQMMRTANGNELRETVARNAAFIQMSLERDFQLTGVGLQSTGVFGSLSVWSDTVAIFRVPFNPTEAPPYDLNPPAGTNNPLAPGGTCGVRCLDLQKDAGTFDIAVGDVARLQISGTRRIILIESVQDLGATFRVGFTNHTELLKYAAGLNGGLLLDRFSTMVQKLGPIVYYLEGDTLKRAEQLNVDGSLVGEPMAYDVQSFDVSLIFVDGDEADNANPTDADATNDYDDILGVRIRAELAADRIDPRVNNGVLYTRSYEWWFAPRNLMYERNR